MRGLQRRQGVKERRHPVTVPMLRWLRDQLDIEVVPDHAVLWTAIDLAYFFLLRVSEYAATGADDIEKRGLRGLDLEGRKLGLPTPSFAEADELVLTIRGSKTDQLNRGAGTTLALQETSCARSPPLRLCRSISQNASNKALMDGSCDGRTVDLLEGLTYS